MLNKNEIVKMVKGAIWDYAIEPFDFYLIALGKKAKLGFFNQERALLRLLERLSWYELLALFGKDFLKENLTVELITKIKRPEIRQKYDLARKVLQGGAISTTGWSAENRKRIKASILSDRRYCA